MFRYKIINTENGISTIIKEVQLSSKPTIGEKFYHSSSEGNIEFYEVLEIIYSLEDTLVNSGIILVNKSQTNIEVDLFKSPSIRRTYNVNDNIYIICNDSDGFKVKLPNNDEISYGTGFTLEDIESSLGILGATPVSTHYSSDNCNSIIKECIGNEKLNDTQKWITIGRKRVDRHNSSGLSFSVPENSIRVGLYLRNLQGLYLANLKTNQPDIYGNNSWDIHRDFGGRYVNTNFHKGVYTVFGSTGGPRVSHPSWKYDLEVKCLIEMK